MDSAPIRQTAFSCGAQTVHTDPECLQRVMFPVELDGLLLPAHPRTGVRERWRPCPRCGAALVATLATHRSGPAGAWLFTLYPRSAASGRGWQDRRAAQLTEFLTEFAALTGAPAVSAGRTGLAGTVYVAGRFHDAAALTARALVRVLPLPAGAERLAASDPGTFSVQAQVYVQLAESAFPDYLADVAGSIVPPVDARPRRRAARLWRVAGTVVTPAA